MRNSSESRRGRWVRAIGLGILLIAGGLSLTATMAAAGLQKTPRSPSRSTRGPRTTSPRPRAPSGTVQPTGRGFTRSAGLGRHGVGSGRRGQAVGHHGRGHQGAKHGSYYGGYSSYGYPSYYSRPYRVRYPRYAYPLYPSAYYDSAGYYSAEVRHVNIYTVDPGATALYPTEQAGTVYGFVELDVQPVSAQVLVDGMYVGRVSEFLGASRPLALVPGIHSLQFMARGYRTLQFDVEVGPGRRYLVSRDMEVGEDPVQKASVIEIAANPDPAKRGTGGIVDANLPGRVQIHATPGDAAVYLDGEFLGRADALGGSEGARAIALGRHVIEVVRPGYASETLHLLLETEQPQKIRIELKPAD